MLGPAAPFQRQTAARLIALRLEYAQCAGRKEDIMGIRKRRHGDSPPEVAANGLIDRRTLLGRGVLIAGAIGTGVTTSLTSAADEPLPVDPWSMEIGTAIPPYGQPA